MFVSHFISRLLTPVPSSSLLLCAFNLLYVHIWLSRFSLSNFPAFLGGVPPFIYIYPSFHCMEYVIIYTYFVGHIPPPVVLGGTTKKKGKKIKKKNGAKKRMCSSHSRGGEQTETENPIIFGPSGKIYNISIDSNQECKYYN
jgi:hypothetical protein